MVPTRDTADHDREQMLADMGELTGPLVHEFNNLLNSLTLHMALWDKLQPATQREDLSELRKHIKQVVGLTAQMQDRRRSLAGVSGACALDEVIRGELACPELVAAGQNAVRIQANLASTTTNVPLASADVRRLCRFLLVNAVRATLNGGREVIVRTARHATTATLVVEDNGPSVPPPLLVRLFEPTFDGRSGVMGLEMATCRSLVTRSGGTIAAREREGGGLIVEAQLTIVTI
jgi:signal transduction histidine kinase